MKRYAVVPRADINTPHLYESDDIGDAIFARLRVGGRTADLVVIERPRYNVPEPTRIVFPQESTP